MEAITAWALEALSTVGIAMLLLLSYVGSLGIPFPVTLVIMAAGAGANAGLLDPWLALLASLAGAVLADHSEYLLGRLAQPWLAKRLGQWAAWRQANAVIQRQGSLAILLTRFWLTPLAPAVNLIAGGRYPYPRFLLFDLAGELLWVLMYGGLGYLFAAQWRQIGQSMSGFSVISMTLVAVGFGASILAKRRKQLVYTENKPTLGDGTVRLP
jgi:membrane protein DedA with SNARE-associated domain